MQEDFNFNFDKFIDDIARRETPVEQLVIPQETTPQREYIRKYGELPQNRVNWRR